MAAQNASTDLFDAYFRRADLDGDGQISGAEAVAFFQGSGLSKQVLAQVWMHSDQRKAGFLSRQEFYNFLKLVTVAQSKRELTQDIVKAALYGPASAKIPAPQINLAATPASKVGVPAAQLTSSTSAIASQNAGIRPAQAPGIVSVNHQHFPMQPNQYPRPPQTVPSIHTSPSQQLPTGQVMPKGGNVGVPSSPSSSVSTNLLVGNTSGPTSLIPSRGVGPPTTQDAFGMAVSGLTPVAQVRPQMTAGQMHSSVPKPQNPTLLSDEQATKDPKRSSENGFSSESLFGDVFAAGHSEPKQGSLQAASSTSNLSVSSAIVSSSVESQPSAGPSVHNSSQLTYSQQPRGDPETGKQNEKVSIQTAAAPPSSGFSVGAGNSVSNQSQLQWPKMTQSDIQKYMRVFIQVDTDRDGKVTGEQARNLFLSWRLPREILKQVWDLSDQDNDSMLSLREFCTALYLMERFREGRPLPATLPSSVISDETLLSMTSHPTASHGSGTWTSAPGLRYPHAISGPRLPATTAAAKPPRPPSVPHTDEKQPPQPKPRVPVLEKHIVDQLSQEEQNSLNSKFQEASQADKKVEELEKEISDSRQKIEFYRAKMQELILYKSRCENRLNEVTARVSSDRREVDVLERKYMEKCKQAGDVASRLTIEEATFRDIQEKKMELYKAIVKMEEGGTAEDVIKERAESIQSSLEVLVKSVNERCKQYGLRTKPTSLAELPFGWQPGIQEGAADWDEDWDKFEDEGYTFVKELTLDVQNVVASPKEKSSIRKGTTSSKGDINNSPLDAESKSQKVPSSGELNPEIESSNDQNENGVAGSPQNPAQKSPKKGQANQMQNYPFRETTDSSPHSKEATSETGGTESVLSDDRSVNESHWGAFDSHYDTESVWGFDSFKGKDYGGEEGSLFGIGGFNLNPIKTGSSREKSPFVFADSVPSTPAYDHGKNSFVFDSVPSTPAYGQGKSSFVFDSVPSTPAYNQGKSSFVFDSVPSTPAYNQGKSILVDSVPSTPAYKLGEGSEGHSFDSFSRFDSFKTHDGGLFQSSDHSLSRFDSMHSTGESSQTYKFASSFDSFKDSEQSHGFSRFDSFRDSDPSHGFSRFDSFRDSDQNHGFSRFDSFRDSEPGQGFPSSFDSFSESRDPDHSLGFSRYDSFGKDNSMARFDSFRGSKDTGNSHGFPSFDDHDPFDSSGPFKSSVEGETPKRSSDSWRAF